VHTIIPATLEAAARRIMVRAWPQAKIRSYLKNKLGVEHLPSKYKALSSSIPSIATKKKKGEENSVV
jgi:hypothetical protein